MRAIVGAPLHLGEGPPQHRRHHEHMRDAIAGQHVGETFGAGHFAIVAEHDPVRCSSATKNEWSNNHPRAEVARVSARLTDRRPRETPLSQTGEFMTMALRWTSAGALMTGLLVGLSAPAGAAGLQPGEYACAGSGGTILIGLGFRLHGERQLYRPRRQVRGPRDVRRTRTCASSAAISMARSAATCAATISRSTRPAAATTERAYSGMNFIATPLMQ